MFRFLGKIARNALVILGVVLFVGAVYSVVFPKDFPVLSSFNPIITSEMFALSSLPLACLGFLTAFKSRTSVPISIISLSLLLISIFNLTNLNIPFPLFRLVLYVSWVLSYGAAKFLKFIYELHRGAELKFSMRPRLFGRSFEIRKLRASVIVCFMLLMLLSPLILTDYQANVKGYSNYAAEDVDSTLNFLKLVKDGDVVVPQEGTQDLLLHAGIEPTMLMHGDLLKKIYSINTLQNLTQAIHSKYPNASRAQVFMLQKWIGSKYYPILSVQFARAHQLGSVAFYTIPLSFYEKELLESPITVQLPAGPQWVIISLDLTEADLSNGGIIALKIVNHGESKTFIGSITDTHGNSTEKTFFSLQPGDNIYSISLHNLTSVVDLSNPATLELNFSWISREPSIDLIITNMTLIIPRY